MNVIASTLRAHGLRALLLSAFLSLVAATPASASGNDRASGAYVEGEPRVEARLLVGSDADRIGVLFDIEPGWHVYWKNPGATGLPTELTMQADGARVGPVLWPAPEPFDAGGDADGPKSFGYADQVLLASALELDPAWAAERPRTARVDVDLLVCERECIPAHFELARELTPDAADAAATSALFQQYAARVPKSPSALGMELEVWYSQSAIRPGDHFEAAIAVHSCRNAADADCTTWTPDAPAGAGGAREAFFPELTEPVELTLSDAEPYPASPRTHLLTFAGASDGDEAIAVDRLRGVLRVRSEDGAHETVAVDLPLPAAAAGAPVTMLGQHWLAAPAASTAGALGLWKALLLALVGGLVLNLMPCVLPVLAIKVFGVA